MLVLSHRQAVPLLKGPAMLAPTAFDMVLRAARATAADEFDYYAHGVENDGANRRALRYAELMDMFAADMSYEQHERIVATGATY